MGDPDETIEDIDDPDSDDCDKRPKKNKDYLNLWPREIYGITEW